MTRPQLVETEAKRLVAMQQMMTTEEAMRWVDTVVAILTRHIADRETLQQISLDLNALVSDRSGTAGGQRSSAISSEESPISNGGV